MTYADQMLEGHPGELSVERAVLVRCIEACYACAHACTACADDCLGEENVAELVKCIRTNLDCADVCQTAGRVVARQTEPDANVMRAVVDACAQACGACADECERHAEHGMEHCRVCAEACRRCEDACAELLGAIAA